MLACTSLFVYAENIHQSSDLDEARQAQIAETRKRLEASGYGSETDAAGRPVIRVQFEGMDVVAPVYVDTAHLFTMERLRFDRSLFSELADFLEMTSRKLMHDGQSMIRFGLTNLRSIIGLLSGCKSKSREFRKKYNDPSPRLNGKYDVEQGHMLHELADATSVNKIDGKQAHALSVRTFGALRAIINESPVGLYLDWSKMTIDGQRLPQWVAPVVQQLRDDGRGRLLKVFHQVADSMISKQYE